MTQSEVGSKPLTQSPSKKDLDYNYYGWLGWYQAFDYNYKVMLLTIFFEVRLFVCSDVVCGCVALATSSSDKLTHVSVTSWNYQLSTILSSYLYLVMLEPRQTDQGTRKIFTLINPI